MDNITKTQEDILCLLLDKPEKQFTIRGVARELGRSYPSVYNNLLGLERKEAITKTDLPPSKIISLNEFAPPDILIDIELKRKRGFLKKHPWVRVFMEDILLQDTFFILLVFGSYAKGLNKKNSDLDLLFIVPSKDDIAIIEAAALKSYTKVKKGLNIVDSKDFIEMVKNTSFNVCNEAKKHHIILYGVEAYYSLWGKVR